MAAMVPGSDVHQPLGRHEDLVVVGGEVLGDQVGIDELVALLAMRLLEADGEGHQPGLSRFGEQADDDAGIDAAGKQHADRHVGDHAARHRLAQSGSVMSRHSSAERRTSSLGALEHRRPVDAILGAPVRLDDADGGGRQLLHALQHGERRRHHGVERHVEMQRGRIDLRVDAARRQQRRQRRGEAEPSRLLG